MLKNKQMADPIAVLELFFELFRCQDKALRKYLYASIVSDIKAINSKRKDPKLNKVHQHL
jgi:protein SDA1